MVITVAVIIVITTTTIIILQYLPQASLVRTPMHHYVKQSRSRKEVKLARLANSAFNCDAETL